MKIFNYYFSVGGVLDVFNTIIKIKNLNYIDEKIK